MRYFPALFLCLLFLSGCASGLQKSLSAEPVSADFRSAIYVAGDTAISRTVVYLVALEASDEMALMTHVHRHDGQPAGVARVQENDRSLPYERIAIGGMPGGLIRHTQNDIAESAKNGRVLQLCGALGCYPIEVPATLYQQALLE